MNFDPIIVDYARDAHKLLSDNRAAYIAQSAASRHGEVAPFPSARRPVLPAGQAATPPEGSGGRSFSPLPARQSPPENNKAGGQDFYDDDPPSDEEIAEAAAFKFGELQC
jgi:hypothetical protein